MSLANQFGPIAAANQAMLADPTVAFSYVSQVSQFNTLQDESSNGVTFTHLDPPQYLGTGKFDGSWQGLAYAHTSAQADDRTKVALGSSDFTIEFFFLAGAEPASTTPICKWGTAGNRCWYVTYDASGNRFRFLASTDGTTTDVQVNYDFDVETKTLANIFDGNWHHLAVYRSSGTIYIAIDGDVASGSASTATPANPINETGTFPFLIGAATVSNATPTASWQYPLDEIRITVGSSRYTSADFTPPSAKFPRGSGSDGSWSNVKLLCGMDTPFGVNSFGNVTTVQTMSGNGIAFTGITADGLARRGGVNPPYVAYNSNFLFDAGDFTIEVFDVINSTTWSSSVMQILGVCIAGTAGEQSWAIRYNNTKAKFEFVFSTDGSTLTAVDFDGITPTSATTYDLTVVRKGTMLYLYVNGTRVNSYTIGSASLYAPTATPLGVCAGVASTPTSFTNVLDTTCRIKAYRITKGAWRYQKATYTVPTLPLPTS